MPIQENANLPTAKEAELAHDLRQARTAKFVRVELDISLDHPMTADELRIFGDVVAQHVQATMRSAKVVCWTKLNVSNPDFKWDN